MSNPWPAPILRQRQNNLGWLALSPPEDELRIGATGRTRQEAEASYARHRAVSQALSDVRLSDLDEQVSPAGPNPEDVNPEGGAVEQRDKQQDEHGDDAPAN